MMLGHAISITIRITYMFICTVAAGDMTQTMVGKQLRKSIPKMFHASPEKNIRKDQKDRPAIRKRRLGEGPTKDIRRRHNEEEGMAKAQLATLGLLGGVGARLRVCDVSSTPPIRRLH
nr:hypothetical protein Itr_chr12CG13240 [Ipomoea trifida]